jgi:5-methylthioadenosine/S-adenosylhomocysteine deaminase
MERRREICMAKTLVEAGWVVTEARMDAVLKNGAIAIENDRIVDVGLADDVRRRFSPDKTISAPQAALLPGLINTHTHLVGGFNKGITEDLSGHGLFRRARPLQEDYVHAEDIYFPGLAHGIEMLMTGTTTINETWWNQAESAKVVRDLGIRAVLGEMVRETPITGSAPGVVERKWDRALVQHGLDKTIELIETWHGYDNGRITCRVAPHAPDMLSEWGFGKLKDIAEKYDLGFHMHLAQVPGEAEYVQAAHGLSPVAYMQRLGLLGERMIGVHCVFLGEADVDLMSQTRTAMSHTAYLVAKRAYFPPMSKIYGTGVQVTLGSDWCSNDMWKIMRTAITLARVTSGRTDILTGYDALRMATLDGARALGMAKDLGTLEVGKKADAIIVDLSNAWCRPIRDEDIITNLVYNANGSDVTHVLVDGKVVVADRRLQTLDQDETLKQAQLVASRVWESAAELFR